MLDVDMQACRVLTRCLHQIGIHAAAQNCVRRVYASSRPRMHFSSLRSSYHACLSQLRPQQLGFSTAHSGVPSRVHDAARHAGILPAGRRSGDVAASQLRRSAALQSIRRCHAPAAAEPEAVPHLVPGAVHVYWLDPAQVTVNLASVQPPIAICRYEVQACGSQLQLWC